jgi:predicted DNA-binding helix-hairpin-helix protein
MAMLARRQVEGIFLSSGIAGSPVGAMDRLLATAEILRSRHRFTGYMHLKIMPGATYSQVEAAVALADRVSLNLEAPNAAALSRIAGAKVFQEDMWTRLQWVSQLTARGQGPRAGQTTQFVVGAAGETDLELLTTTDRLYHEIHLARAYFSAFRPVPGTPLEHVPPTPVVRQRRLYQADELVFDTDGDLPSANDPKMAWALRHPERFPVELNRAGRDDLLRVPGIGPRAAARILAMKRDGRLRNVNVLKAAGATVSRAAPFVLLDGVWPAPRQLAML